MCVNGTGVRKPARTNATLRERGLCKDLCISTRLGVRKRKSRIADAYEEPPFSRMKCAGIVLTDLLQSGRDSLYTIYLTRTRCQR